MFKLEKNGFCAISLDNLWLSIAVTLNKLFFTGYLILSENKNQWKLENNMSKAEFTLVHTLVVYISVVYMSLIDKVNL